MWCPSSVSSSPALVHVSRPVRNRAPHVAIARCGRGSYPGPFSIRDWRSSGWPLVGPPLFTQEVSPKRLIGLLVVLLVSSVAWTDAHADFLFISDIVCGNAVLGRVQILSNGTVKLALSGLPPGTQAECQLVCFITQNFGTPFPCGTANAAGKSSFTMKAAIDPAGLCLAPVLRVELSNGGSCFTGWGTEPTTQ